MKPTEDEKSGLKVIFTFRKSVLLIILLQQVSPTHKDDEISENKSSPLKMKEQISENLKDEKEKISTKPSPTIREKLDERRRILDEYISISQDAKAEEKNINIKRREENKASLTLSNGRKVFTSEKRIEGKENIPRPRSRNIEKVR